MRPDQRPLPVSSLTKLQRQRRSIEMAHVILDAAIMVLQSEGIVGFNTNRVAAVAGVSIGTLYQYYANKEMLVSGIIERGILDSEVLMRESASRAAGMPPEDVMLRVLTDIIEELKPYGLLLREVLQITPYVSAAGVIPLLETRMGDLFRGWFLGDGMDYLPVGGSAGMTGLVRTAVHLTLRHLAEVRPDESDQPFIEATAGILAAGVRRRDPLN